MTQLTLNNAIPRFKANEERIDKLVNGTNLETWQTSAGETLPSFAKFLDDTANTLLTEFETTITSVLKDEDIGVTIASIEQGQKADTAVQPEDIGTAAAQNVEDFATSIQGGKADTALQPTSIGSLVQAYVAGLHNATAYGVSLVSAGDDAEARGVLSLGSAATQEASDFATAAQGARADTAVQFVDLAPVAESGDYNDLTNKPNLALKQDVSAKNQPNGYVGLNASGKVDSEYLPVNGAFKGTWDASTNTPTIIAGTGIDGDWYKVSVAGTQSITGSAVAFGVGDEVRFSSDTNTWVRVPNTQSVSTVFGRTGDIVGTKADVGLGNVDNTSDADKPISDAVAAALAARLRFDINDETMDEADRTVARYNLGLGSLAVKSSINNADWSGTALTVANGGTGGTTQATARSGLGLGTAAVADTADFQAVDEDLTGIAAQTYAANDLPYATGPGAWSKTTLSAYARTFLDDANDVAARNTLGLGTAAIATVTTSQTDTTAGRLLKVGDFGLGGDINIGSADLDTVAYGFGANNSTANTPTNTPNGAASSRWAWQTFGTVNASMQMAVQANAYTGLFFRTKSVGVWGSWHQMATLDLAQTWTAIQTHNAKISFGASIGSNQQDLSKHLELHTSGYGLSVTSNRFNFNASSSAGYEWFAGGVQKMYLSNAGVLTINGKKAYTLENILGTVSTASSEPTGAIIERGSNTNGEYIKYADGTLIQWARIAITMDITGGTGALFQNATNRTWTFPVAFATTNGVILNGTTVGSFFGGVNFRAVSTADCTYRIWSTTSEPSGSIVHHVTAIGRWN